MLLLDLNHLLSIKTSTTSIENSPSQNYSQADDQKTRSINTPGFETL